MTGTATSAPTVPPATAPELSSARPDRAASPSPAAAPEIADLLEIQVPKGARTVVCGDR